MIDPVTITRCVDAYGDHAAWLSMDDLIVLMKHRVESILKNTAKLSIGSDSPGAAFGALNDIRNSAATIIYLVDQSEKMIIENEKRCHDE